MIDVCIKNIVTNEKKFNKIGNFFCNLYERCFFLSVTIQVKLRKKHLVIVYFCK